jgi:hypothetical protein
MPTLSEAYEHFNAVPTNIRYSWSAFTRDGSSLVCTLWKHDFTNYNYPFWLEGADTQSSGYAEHYRNLRRAIDSGIPITGFIVDANDPHAAVTTVKEAHVDRLFRFTVTVDVPGRIVGRVEGK